MDSGTEDRSRLRRHVRAAREWLGRADESLGRADDVRGDLNLMLARAELTRARETERPAAAVLWSRRLAPLCAAVLIAGGGFWLADRGKPPAAPPAETRPVESLAAPVLTSHPAEAASAAAETAEKAVPVSPVPPEPALTEAEAREPAPLWEPETETETASEPVPLAVEPPEPELQTPVPSQDTRLPSEDLQRLMNSAGQSLRAAN